MAEFKELIIFPRGGERLIDKKAYLHEDMLVSDKHDVAIADMRPTKMYKWVKEGAEPKFLNSSAYMLMDTPPATDNNARMHTLLRNIWKACLGGKRISASKLSDNAKIQIVGAVAGVMILFSVLGIWFVSSQMYEIPESAPVVIEETDGQIIPENGTQEKTIRPTPDFVN